MGHATHWFKTLAASAYWFSKQRRWRIRDIFNDVYRGQTQSPTFRKILRDALGDEYPEEVEPCGFLTKTDLRHVALHLNVGPGQAFVDLGCGRGGGGLWVARETGAALTGVDLSKTAIADAQRRIAAFGLTGRAQFRVGEFANSGLPSASYDGAMSIDTLYLVADKTGSLAEVARLLRPGARFVFTTWDVDAPRMIRDHRPLLHDAGFAVERYEATPDWERRQRAVHEQVLVHQEALIREMGSASAKFWIVGAQTELPRLTQMCRVLIVAHKR